MPTLWRENRDSLAFAGGVGLKGEVFVGGVWGEGVEAEVGGDLGGEAGEVEAGSAEGEVFGLGLDHDVGGGEAGDDSEEGGELEGVDEVGVAGPDRGRVAVSVLPVLRFFRLMVRNSVRGEE